MESEHVARLRASVANLSEKDVTSIEALFSAFPDACRTGVQSTPLFPNLTNSFRLPTESGRRIGGDRVATSGPLPAEILSEASAGVLHVVSACGLRYAYLPGKAASEGGWSPQILVALPLVVQDATELLELVFPLCIELVGMDWVSKATLTTLSSEPPLLPEWAPFPSTPG